MHDATPPSSSGKVTPYSRVNGKKSKGKGTKEKEKENAKRRPRLYYWRIILEVITTDRPRHMTAVTEGLIKIQFKRKLGWEQQSDGRGEGG